MIYNTAKGMIRAHWPTTQQLINLKKGLSLGLVELQTKESFFDFGMVTKCGQEEALCLKQQSLEVPIEEERKRHMANLKLVAESVARYLRHGFTGCLVPTLYKRQKSRVTEMGIVYFGKPSQRGIEANEFEPRPAYDSEMGDGFFTMYKHFNEEIKQSGKRIRITTNFMTGLDIVKRSQLGNIQILLIIQSRTLFLCAPTLTKGDTMLRTLASCGVKDFVHLAASKTSFIFPVRITPLKKKTGLWQRLRHPLNLKLKRNKEDSKIVTSRRKNKYDKILLKF